MLYHFVRQSSALSTLAQCPRIVGADLHDLAPRYLLIESIPSVPTRQKGCKTLCTSVHCRHGQDTAAAAVEAWLRVLASLILHKMTVILVASSVRSAPLTLTNSLNYIKLDPPTLTRITDKAFSLYLSVSARASSS
ncbi:hypothetical protein [Sporisorium scitamineum]|uniref:Uncharacterized protein n=1 Tax=Sporisorium scitamineum TaxID=49012 RepID=A0A0F7S1Q4_9BASI|nr:hypothetical protein [Sporisorium scitamineum]